MGDVAEQSFAASSSSGVTIEPGKLLDTDAARFRERSAKSGMRDTPHLWGEATEQVENGWPRHPVTLGAAGRPDGLRPKGYNVDFRLGVEQAAKLRARDDLKRSLANSARTILAPIQLVSWGHFPQLCRACFGSVIDWSLFKAYHEAAYKQLPLEPIDQARAVIAIRRPGSGKWFGLVSRTLVFGATAAVLRYNVFARLVTTLANRPMGSRLSDFSAISRL